MLEFYDMKTNQNPENILSVVIPVYNEKNSVELLVNAVFEVPISKEVILVDDGSTDGTTEIIQSSILKKYPSIHFIRHEKNQGKGAAIRTGFDQVKGDRVIIQDADMEYNPMDYVDLLKPFDDPSVMIVYGSRFLSQKKVTNAFHYGVNKFITVFGNILFGAKLTDLETCYKVFRRNVLESLNLVSDGFEIEAEMTAKILKAKHKIVEVPISYYGRNYIQGKKITWVDGIVTLWILIKLKFSRD